MQQTPSRSSGRIVTKEGSLYPVLYKLQEQGLISEYKSLTEGIFLILGEEQS